MWTENKEINSERIIYNMDKNQIIEAAFETIKESTKWGIEDKSDRYGHFVDGVVTMTDNILNKMKEEKN